MIIGALYKKLVEDESMCLKLFRYSTQMIAGKVKTQYQNGIQELRLCAFLKFWLKE